MTADVTRSVLSARGPKNVVDVDRAYVAIVERERAASGSIDDVATIFLTNRECPFHCVMCDLWKNTTDERVPVGAIPRQIQTALESLPPARHIKLYNSGNFFDAQAIPPEDHAAIAEIVRPFETVIVENHPRLCGDSVLQFQHRLNGQLEVAMGLETSHEATLERLNKQMTLADFGRACEFLERHQIRSRAFILLKPPWTSEQDGIDRAMESVRFAFDAGVDCCAVIPTRGGNGIMEQLAGIGDFGPPQLESLEAVQRETLSWNRGRVFVDLWDVERFTSCDKCAKSRIEHLQDANLNQVRKEPPPCSSCGGC